MKKVFEITLKVSIIISLSITIILSLFKLTILSYSHFLEPTLYADSFRLVEQTQNSNETLIKWIYSQQNVGISQSKVSIHKSNL